ncbi:NAD(P)H-dependent oxidoreductase [Variovorax sp. J31P179]|uniref:NADPH-dependent FMN reductase n=1 Tax=Variovorax sp. J31P179 TaxID=3053508 RepID=UPI002578453E|nr:NAD(P)H-dependent oxidoreductase [Variovorax sp. J31P179]MDM0085420.1 NAD(P)H-dependent oxidoreductase [Variovorax sp. J31P179]
MASENQRLLGISGSQRQASYNTMALRLAAEQVPPHSKLDVVDWRSIPPFDADYLARSGYPRTVAELRAGIEAADGIVIATPEYNFSIPGMLKNLLDWVSRGADQPLARKPVAILSASPGPLGGARVQYDLGKVLLFMDARVLAKPEVFIGNAAAKFDAEGRCIDVDTIRFVGLQMTAFSTWIDQVRRM